VVDDLADNILLARSRIEGWLTNQLQISNEFISSNCDSKLFTSNRAGKEVKVD
jgi:hypothetical protein